MRRQTMRRFVQRELAPHVERWEEAMCVPREVFRKAGAAGLLGVALPEEYGGSGGGHLALIDLCDEVAAAGSGGLLAALTSHQIALPPIAHAGSEELKRRVLPAVIAGEKIAALGVTEPGGGSDVAALRTTATRRGESYVVNGEKTFITGGVQADYVTVAVRTGGEGAKGVSLLLVETSAPGFTASPLRKMGWHCSDTAHLSLSDVVVPASHLIGAEGDGFKLIMRNFNNERLMLAAMSEALARACFEEALGWARERVAFGARLADHQAVAHKLVEMETRCNATRAYLNAISHALSEGRENGGRENLVPPICQLKNLATHNLERVASDAVQLLGGMGYVRGAISERVFRETKVMQIGGGATEVMKDLAARQAGY